ncbi:MAG: hypothetical protein IK079_01325, partial [Desulfovibrio sp.]|nr:hypothetical protein [Desulfovibrio sp.]
MRLLLLCLFLLLPQYVHAALTTKEPSNKESAYNPQKNTDDILLPMPCGLSMVFRTVGVPGKVLDDRHIYLGINKTDAERTIY